MAAVCLWIHKNTQVLGLPAHGAGGPEALWWQVPPSQSWNTNSSMSRYTGKHLFTHFYRETHVESSLTRFTPACLRFTCTATLTSSPPPAALIPWLAFHRLQVCPDCNSPTNSTNLLFSYSQSHSAETPGFTLLLKFILIVCFCCCSKCLSLCAFPDKGDFGQLFVSACVIWGYVFAYMSTCQPS